MVELALQHIKSKRLSKNYTQEYLAKRLSITQTQYSRIESGKSSVSLNTLIAIIKVLDMEEIEFLSELIESYKINNAHTSGNTHSKLNN
ncbi:MAG: helix-turn-helix transcriptional regulator [Flavobacterium sp. JAD_PAG50586_2]|nr:MAG: helix-turn-helix transcriptional regulator [Flavobacterium sp. JAD_PAG50586_2]